MTLRKLAMAVQICTACELYRDATQEEAYEAFVRDLTGVAGVLG